MRNVDVLSEKLKAPRICTWVETSSQRKKRKKKCEVIGLLDCIAMG